MSTERIRVVVLSLNGECYLRNPLTQEVYNPNTRELVGRYDPVAKRIIRDTDVLKDEFVQTFQDTAKLSRDLYDKVTAIENATEELLTLINVHFSTIQKIIKIQSEIIDFIIEDKTETPADILSRYDELAVESFESSAKLVESGVLAEGAHLNYCNSAMKQRENMKKICNL